MTGDRTRPTAWFASAGAGVASAALFASSVWVPPVGFLLSLLSPLPVALATWRRGTAGAVMATLAGGAAALALTGLVGASVYSSQFAAGGCVLGAAARARRRPEVVVGSYAVVTSIAFWSLLAILAARSGTGPLAYLGETLDRSLEQASGYLLQGQTDAQATLAIQSWAEETGRFLRQTFPGLFAAVSILTGWANAVFLRRLVREPDSETWTLWKAPESWIWVLIAAGLGTFLAGGVTSHVARNVFLAAATVYFLQGIAVVQHVFESRRFPPLLRGVAYALLFVQLPVMLLVAALGAFDLWFDFRARWAPPEPPSR